jgi:hypothetical protein
MEKSVDSVHASWTAASGGSTVDPHGGTDGKSLESGRDSAPACRCSPVAAGKGKGSMGDSPRGSPKLRKQRSGRATTVKWRRWWGSAGACSNVGEEERGVVSGAGCSGAEVPFYRDRGRAPDHDNGQHRRSGLMVEGGGSCTKGDGNHGSSSTTAAQAGRWRGSAWLLGLKRMKGARRSGRERGGAGPGRGEVGWAAWAGR